jgi:hypothetical protein
MNTVNSVNWDLLLSTLTIRSIMTKWSDEEISSRQVSDLLKGGRYAGAFRHLIRTNGTTYGRRLARKAINYRFRKVN